MKHRLVAMIDRNLDAFAENDDDLGHTPAIEHDINTGDAAPIRQKLGPLPYHRRGFVEKEVERYLRLGIISKADPAKCPWASPIVVVTKKKTISLKCWMLCAFERTIEVNKLTVKMHTPLHGSRTCSSVEGR